MSFTRMGIMSLGFIIGVVVLAIVAYVTWKNRQDSFSKTHLGTNTEFASHQKEIEDRPDEGSQS